VRRGAAVGVDDDLAAGEAAVALRAADHEASGRIHEVLDVPGDRDLLRVQHRLDDLLDHRLLDVLVLDFRVVLRGQHHGVDLGRLAVHVLHRDLALRVRAQPLELAALAQLRLQLDETMREVDGQRHETLGLGACVAEHQALVARTLLEVEALALVHALRDVRRLLVVGHEHGAPLVVDAVVGVVVADFLDGVARDLLEVHHRVGGDLAGHHHEAGVAQRLGGDARILVLREDGVEHRVGDLVRDLVRVTLGNRLGCEEKAVRHTVLVCLQNPC
jgi:hypothetical protein